MSTERWRISFLQELSGENDKFCYSPDRCETGTCDLFRPTYCSYTTQYDEYEKITGYCKQTKTSADNTETNFVYRSEIIFTFFG